jgi:hypothetical protein
MSLAVGDRFRCIQLTVDGSNVFAMARRLGARRGAT